MSSTYLLTGLVSQSEAIHSEQQEAVIQMQSTAGEVAELWVELMPFAQGSGPPLLQRLAAVGREGRDIPSLARAPERLVLESHGQARQQ